MAEKRFSEIAQSVDPQLRGVTPPNQTKYHARKNSADNKSEQRHYFQQQIVSIAGKFGYYANMEAYRSWIRMTFTTEQELDYVIRFHGYGPGDSGILAASAFTYVKAPKEEGGTEPVKLSPAATDFFQFNYVESYDTIEARFKEWLESSYPFSAPPFRLISPLARISDFTQGVLCPNQNSPIPKPAGF
jgi:hypothetical protein